MAELINKNLAELLKQAKYAPEKQRLLQLDACEAFMRLIRPGKSYPFDFITFHITGYHPKSSVTSELIPYQTLLSDIPAYCRHLSRTINLWSIDIPQKVYTTADICKRFRICEKTLNRWQKQGLLSRYIRFEDGRIRLGFLASSINFFLRKNRQRVEQSTLFSRLSDTERQAILKRLYKWSRRCPGHRNPAIRRTAKKFHRSVETIRTLLQQHNALVSQEKDTALPLIGFIKRAETADRPLCEEICTRYMRQISVESLARQYNRSRSNIYRAINLGMLWKLQSKEIETVESEEFHILPKEKFLNEPRGLFTRMHNASDILRSGLSQGENPPQGSAQETIRKPNITRAGNRPADEIDAYYRQISQVDVLTAEQERFLFRKFNYLKYLARQEIRSLDWTDPSGRQIRTIRRYVMEAESIKHFLIRSNLRLVVSIARKHTRNEQEMPELVSEGNLAILNAVEKFNYERGVKFSTYATWAVMKRFAGLRRSAVRSAEGYIESDILETLADKRYAEPRISAIEAAESSLRHIIDKILDHREKQVVFSHYGMQETPVSSEPAHQSLSQIAQWMGLSKERVRQIELSALQKLRSVLSREQFEILAPAYER